MKKVLLSMLAMAIAAFSFTGCDDVPMPYDMPGAEGDSGTNGNPSGEGTVADPFNVAAALSYIKAGDNLDQDVYVKGIIVSIEEVNTSFGNATFNISDDGTNTNVLKVYRSKSLNNQSFKSESEIKVGDEVVIVGKLVNYSGTYEFTQGCYIYSLNQQGGGGTTPSAGTGTGTETDPYDVAAAISLASKTGVFVKGYIVGYVTGQNIDEGAIFSASGADVSQTNVLIAATPNETTVANCMPVQLPAGAVRTGVNLKDNPGNLKQEVLLYGDIDTYFRVPGIKNTTYAKIGTKESGTKPGGTTPSGDAKGSGTEADPFNPVAAYNEAAKLAADAVSSKDYYVKGKVSSVTYQFDQEHGTATFRISEDGTANGEFIVYGCKYFGNTSWQNGNKQINAGDEVVICGKFTNYKGNTPEFASGQNWLVSLNGETGGNDTPQTSDDAGSYASPLTVTAAIALANADQAWVRGYIVGYVGGQAYKTDCKFTADGASQTNILIAASATETDPEKCMPVQLPAGDFRTKLNLKDNPNLLGQSVLLYAQLTAYFSVPGLKAPSYGEVGNQQIGTRPSAARRR